MVSRFTKNEARVRLVNSLMRIVVNSKIEKSKGKARLQNALKKVKEKYK
jgi:hypothetical protein